MKTPLRPESQNGETAPPNAVEQSGPFEMSRGPAELDDTLPQQACGAGSNSVPAARGLRFATRVSLATMPFARETAVLRSAFCYDAERSIPGGVEELPDER
jgi:hypothetical protein